MKSQTESYTSYQKEKLEPAIFSRLLSLLFALLSGSALPACLIPFPLVMRRSVIAWWAAWGTWATIPPCFQSDPSVKGTDRPYKVTWITNYARVLVSWRVSGPCQLSCPLPPQLPQLLITMSQRLITWQRSFSNFHIEGKRASQETVWFNDRFANHFRGRIYLQVINTLHKSKEDIKTLWGSSLKQ